MSTDYIELFVYDDGDISLVKRQAGSLKSRDRVLIYDDLEGLGTAKLFVELISYGCEGEVASRSIQEVIDSDYGKEILVK